MLVHRLLDAVFRTLDTIDAVRARVDALLGKAEPQPPSQWPTPTPAEAERVATTDTNTPAEADTSTSAPSSTSSTSARSARSAKGQAKRPRATTTPQPQSAKSQAPKPKRAPAAKTTTSTSSSSRKGSVDRSGKDFDSPRARTIAAAIEQTGRPIIAEDAELDGKKTLARVLWAVAAGDDSGVEGMTAADVSAVLSLVAGIEVFATNVARAFRDEPTLFIERGADGRSKRYAVTALGKARVAEVAMRATRTT
jgi:hypothetical protein